MKKATNRNVGISGGRCAHEAVSRRPPIYLYRIIAHTHMHMYATKCWALSTVQGPFPVAPCQTFTRYDSHLLSSAVTLGVAACRCKQGRRPPTVPSAPYRYKR
jgi:hypothetical protein